MSRRHIHIAPDTGAKIADKVADTVGSWRFILIQSAFLAAWIIFNSLAFTYHWDGPPFILLNLMLSFQAAFTGPFVMMSQNRQAQKDRLRDDLEAQEVAELFQMNKTQLEILEALHKLQAQKKPTK
jgi:uncharacterized membrane protein